jgi:hypothetical protein
LGLRRGNGLFGVRRLLYESGEAPVRMTVERGGKKLDAAFKAKEQ